MKIYIILIILVLMSSLANAQNNSNIGGQYNLGSSSPEGGSHLFVLENGDYAITYFGGIQTGKWKIQEEDIYLFTPNISASKFELFGRYNNRLKGKTKISFNGFENAQTFVQLRKEKEEKFNLQRVFNTDANCFSYPYLHTFNIIAGNISFTFVQGGNPGRSITTFKNPKGFNDFVATFIEVDIHEGQPFLVTFRDDKLYFNEDDYAIKNPLNEDDEDFLFIKAIIDKETKRDTIYFNPWYNLFGESENELGELNISEHYVFNEQKNAFINIANYDEGVENTTAEESYDNMSIIYSYKALLNITEQDVNYKLNEEPLFKVSCD